VLISPLSVQSVDWRWRTVPVDLTREQITRSPRIESDKPVTKQQETAFFDYFGYPYYWSGPLRWGPMPFPPSAGNAMRSGPDHWWEQQRRTICGQGDPHLRSADAVTGYHIEATDGAIGHVQDFLFDEQDWSLRFLAVDTRNWWPGRHVLVAIDWIESVSWGERKVHVSMTRDAIRRAPEWHPEFALLAEGEDYRHDNDGEAEDRQPSDSGRMH
jgi:hypothetical protein